MLKYIFLAGFLFSGIVLYAQNSLTVEVEGLKEKNKGPIIIMLYAEEEGFPRQIDLATSIAKIENYQYLEQPSYTFQNLAAGTYAIALFVDENDNGEIDTNFLGMPKEPIGAANQTGLGRPSFKRSSVTIGTDEVARLTIKLMNN